MPHKEKGYLNIEEKAKKGEYTLVEPYDYFLLEMLPDEGELVMGYYPLAVTSGQLVKEKFKDLTATQVATDLRRLQRQRLVVRVRTRGSSTEQYGFQRTPKGKKLYENWKKSQNSKPEDNK